jgi:hypothetical protein
LNYLPAHGQQTAAVGAPKADPVFNFFIRSDHDFGRGRFPLAYQQTAGCASLKQAVEEFARWGHRAYRVLISA